MLQHLQQYTFEEDVASDETVELSREIYCKQNMQRVFFGLSVQECNSNTLMYIVQFRRSILHFYTNPCVARQCQMVQTDYHSQH